MKTLIFCLLISSYSFLFAQKSDSVAFLSNLKGTAVCIRKGSEEKLKIPFYFIKGDQVKVLNGNAVVVLFTEEEVKLSKGESYTFVNSLNLKPGTKELLIYNNTKQSNNSFKMRAIGDSKKVVFPSQSKLIDPMNAIIQLNVNAKNSTGYFFTLKNKETNEKVFELLNSDSARIVLSSANMKPGFKYSWKIKFKEYDAFGEFVFLTEKQAEQIQIFELNNRASYIKAFNNYCNEECYFEAFKVIEKAIIKYPEDENFKYLKSLLF
jgi:hypothetical protein